MYIHVPCVSPVKVSSNNVGELFNSAVFGEGTGPILDGYLNCSGSEKSVFNCPHFAHSYSGCTHTDDVSIRCEPGIHV